VRSANCHGCAMMQGAASRVCSSTPGLAAGARRHTEDIRYILPKLHRISYIRCFESKSRTSYTVYRTVP